MTTPFLYRLQGASYANLSRADFRIAVVDIDDSGLSAQQTRALGADGKQLLAYVSIGEAEDYRNYWSAGGWGAKPPSFLLGENPDWPGNYRVEFWRPAWKKIAMERVDLAIARGYDGIYLDIVDAYEVAEVQKAYPGSNAELRRAMIDFVVEISKYAKSKRAGFMVVPQNAVGLLVTNENDASSPPNNAYLRAIDGLGIEDLWFDDNNTSPWTASELKFIQRALDADKFVLATSYPTDPAKQAAFVSKALDAGLIPFATDRDLTGKNPASNANTDRELKTLDANTPWSGGADAGKLDIGADAKFRMHLGDNADNELRGSSNDDDMRGLGGDDRLSGNRGDDVLAGGRGDDVLIGNRGADTLKGGAGADRLEGGPGDDLLNGERGDDVLKGGSGADRLNGSAGADRLFGGKGDDVLAGGAGRDALSGGKGADRFVFSATALGRDTVMDFGKGDDTLVFKEFDLGRAALLDRAEQNGSHVVFDFDDAGSVTVLNAKLQQLLDDLLIL